MHRNMNTSKQDTALRDLPMMSFYAVSLDTPTLHDVIYLRIHKTQEVRRWFWTVLCCGPMGFPTIPVSEAIPSISLPVLGVENGFRSHFGSRLYNDSSGEGKRYQVMGNVIAPACQPCCANREDAKDSNSPWVPVSTFLFCCLLNKAEQGDTGEH